jgi:hypothetical protein
MRGLRTLFAAVMLLALGGCGVKSLYDNVDRFILWSVDDFVEMDAAQEAFVRSRLGVFLYWHRTTQLPLYARGMERIEREIRAGLGYETLLELEAMVTGWAETVVAETVPFVAELLHSLTDAQVATLETGLTKNNEKWLKPYRGMSPEARRKRWAQDFVDAFENFSGRLDREQRAVVAAYAERWEPDDAAWLEYRERWQRDLVSLIRARRTHAEFELAFREMATGRERWYGEEYRRIFTANEALYRALTLEMLASLDEKQRQTLSQKLLAFARDFDELAAEAPPTAPAAVCLQTC